MNMAKDLEKVAIRLRHLLQRPKEEINARKSEVLDDLEDIISRLRCLEKQIVINKGQIGTL